YDLNLVIVTYVDEVRADGRHRDGVLRITIACTGVAAAHFSLCLHVKSRHLGDAYRYPTEPRTLAGRLAFSGAQPTPRLADRSLTLTLPPLPFLRPFLPIVTLDRPGRFQRLLASRVTDGAGRRRYTIQSSS
ncbi:hypothetical protein, partial [Rubripirellula obstinata]|uniref:hypothetical protein n=1 Tax=Rubripirellula obstinata TaxID=406547 RepID=UPI001EE47FE1